MKLLTESPLWENLFHRFRSEEESLPTWLQSHPLMRGLSERDVRHFAVLLHRRVYAEGEIVFRQGDIGSGFFLIRSGVVRLTAEDTARGNLPLASLTEGSVVGEMAIFDNSPRSATATAEEDSVLYGLFEGDLDRLQATRPTLAISLLRNLGTSLAIRLKVTNERLQELDAANSTNQLREI